MATSLAEIRAKLQAAETKSSTIQAGGDKAIYPHWNINEGDNCTVRFLPDGNASNSFFWAERAMIRLPFNGIMGDTDSKQVIVQVPCVEMWGEACPILAEVRTWFKDKSLEEEGRKYWKKRSYIFQGFVRQNPISDDVTPENPIRRFVMSPQIFTLIRSALMDTELEELPTDLLRGLDFRISKTSKGGYADYTTSSWARKETALTADEQAAVDKFGLFNLDEFLPKKPSEQELKVIKEMFDASVNGRQYDPDRWSAYYRPSGMMQSAATPIADKVAAPSLTVDGHGDVHDVKVTPAVTEAAPVAPTVQPVTTFETSAPAPTSQKAEDILAMIRARQKAV